MFSCRQRSLQARYGRRLRAHALCNLSLGEPSVMPCLQKLIKEFAFFTLNAVDFPPYARATEQLGNHLIMSSHV